MFPAVEPGRRRGAHRVHRLGRRERDGGSSVRRSEAKPSPGVVEPADLKVLVKEKIADSGVELLRAGLRRRARARLGPGHARGADRRVRRADRPLGDQGHRGSDREGPEPEGRRPRRDGRRQRRHRGRDQARHPGRQRARVELGRRGRAHAGTGARALPQRSAGAQRAGRRGVGALALRRQRALRQDARRDRLRPDRPARRAARAGVRHARPRVRQVRLGGALPRTRGRGRRDQRRALRARRHHHDPPAEDARRR